MENRFPLSLKIFAILVIIGIVLSGLLVASDSLNYRYVTKKSDMKLGVITMLSRNRFVEVNAQAVIYIGYEQIHIGPQFESKGKYYLVLLEDGYMLALLPANTGDYLENYTFEAVVKPIDDNEKRIIINQKYLWEHEYGIVVDQNYIIRSLRQNPIPEGYLVSSLIYTGFCSIMLIIYGIQYLQRKKID